MKTGRVFLLFLTSSLLLFAVLRLIGFNGLYGQDSHEYLRYARELHNNFSTAQPTQYFAPLYPVLGALCASILNPIDSLQLISLLSFSLTLVAAYHIIKRISPASKYIIPFLLCFGFLSPYYLRLSSCIMSDSLACLLLTLTLFAAIVFYQTNQIRYLLLAIGLAIICTLTRFAAAIPLSILLAMLLFTKKRTVFTIQFGLLVAVLLCLLYPFLYLQLLVKATNHPLMHQVSLFNFFHSSFTSADGFASYTFPNCVFMLFPLIHPGFIFIGIALIYFYPHRALRKGEIILSLIPAIAYLLFLSLLPVQNTRLQTLVFPFILISYQPAFEEIMQKFGSEKTLIVAAGLQFLFITLAMRSLVEMNRVERQITTHLKPLQNNYTSVYELGSDGFLQSYNVKIQPISLFSDTLAAIKDSSLLLIQTSAFEKQWKGKLPYNNLEFIKEKMTLSELQQFESGWHLYALIKK